MSLADMRGRIAEERIFRPLNSLILSSSSTTRSNRWEKSFLRVNKWVPAVVCEAFGRSVLRQRGEASGRWGRARQLVQISSYYRLAKHAIPLLASDWYDRPQATLEQRSERRSETLQCFWAVAADDDVDETFPCRPRDTRVHGNELRLCLF